MSEPTPSKAEKTAREILKAAEKATPGKRHPFVSHHITKPIYRAALGIEGVENEFVSTEGRQYKHDLRQSREMEDARFMADAANASPVLARALMDSEKERERYREREKIMAIYEASLQQILVILDSTHTNESDIYEVAREALEAGEEKR